MSAPNCAKAKRIKGNGAHRVLLVASVPDSDMADHKESDSGIPVTASADCFRRGRL